MDVRIRIIGIKKRQRKEKSHNLDVALNLPYQDIDLKIYEQSAIALIKEEMKSWTQVDDEGYAHSMKEVTFGDKRYRKISLEVGF